MTIKRPTAGAQPVAVQETCVPHGDQPANSQQARCDRRSTDEEEELRRDNPGIGDEGIARWRDLAANPPQRKMASDFWYAHVAVTP